ncbi:MAG: FkbM family methyltransferase [Steroidobacteraceae bacterium]
MYNFLLRVYASFFGRRQFRRLNGLLFDLGTRGLGILNYQDQKISGESTFLRQYLRNKKSPVVLDVGANVGVYSREVARVNPSAKVFAFEPHPLAFERLASNLGSDGNFRLYNYALGAQAGGSTLYDRESGNGSSHASIFREVIEDFHHARAKGYNIEMHTLDQFVEENQLERIDLLKIDTEGYELDVLRGGVTTIGSGMVSAIQFEFNEMNVVSRAFFKDFWELLPQYRLYRMLPRGLLSIERYNPLRCELFAFQNIVAVLSKDAGH